jgi:hypothetical protein
MKNSIRLMTIAAVFCSFGCNGTTTRTGSTEPTTSVKQNSQQPTSVAKPAGSAAPTTKPAAPATKPVAPAATAAGPLDGTWVSGCTAEGTTYMLLSLTFAGDQGYQTGTVYSDSACTKVLDGVTIDSAWLTVTIGETDSKTGLTQFTEMSVDSAGVKASQYNVFQMSSDGNTLLLGDASTTVGTYPTAVDTSAVFKKQAVASPIPPQP